MTFTATINTPGYLPWSDNVQPTFETSREAWEYLAQERREQEDSASTAYLIEQESPYSRTVDELDAMASADAGEGTVYGDTPGNDSPHDLGIAYSVSEVRT